MFNVHHVPRFESLVIQVRLIQIVISLIRRTLRCHSLQSDRQTPLLIAMQYQCNPRPIRYAVAVVVCTSVVSIPHSLFWIGSSLKKRSDSVDLALESLARRALLGPSMTGTSGAGFAILDTGELGGVDLFGERLRNAVGGVICFEDAIVRSSWNGRSKSGLNKLNLCVADGSREGAVFDVLVV